MSTSVVVGFIDTVFNQRQLDRLTEYVASDVVDHNQIIFAQPDGPDGLVEGVRKFLSAFPNFQAHVAETMVDTDRVAVRLVMQCTNTGEYRGLPEPTGRHAIWETMAIFRLSAGKIVEIRGAADRMSMLIQRGILPDLG